MAKYHINYVQFYDWQWKHHVPLAGSVTNPATSWTNVANLTNYRQTVLDMISACHTNGMYAMEYNLMYGAWAGYGQDGSGVDSNWSLLTSINGPQWSINMPGGWATPTIYIFNPGNTNWQNYLFSQENKVFSDYGFDGWHLDQLGDWGTMYDVHGNSVDVWTTFAGFLNNAKAATGKRLTFNNVGAYGMYSVCADTSDDAVYVECWPANGQTTYQDLKTTIDIGNQYGLTLPATWATTNLYGFNNRDTNWQNYIYGQEQLVFTNIAFDGWHIDTVGQDTAYDYSGVFFNLEDYNPQFINNAKTALGRRMTFNTVDAGGENQVAQSANVDFVYSELWSANPNYNSFNQRVNNVRSYGSKALVMPAYMDTGLSSGYFNTPLQSAFRSDCRGETQPCHWPWQRRRAL
jgi:hypothetical protein